MTRLLLIAMMVLACLTQSNAQAKYAIIISANAEWRVIRKVYPNEKYVASPWGEYFYKKIANQKVLFLQEGWGKVAAAGATQYVIDQFKPEVLINLGTCGGFEGLINRMDVVLASKTIIYDIMEAMGDSKEAIADYTTEVDLQWVKEPYPMPVVKTTLVSGDRDLRIEEIVKLKTEYNAIAGDWESGAIAYTAHRNKKKVLILRGVTDLVSSQQGEAYGNINLFAERTEAVMKKLLNALPAWINHLEN